jgi:hypothetical protein
MYLNFIASAILTALAYVAMLPLHLFSRSSITGQLVFWISAGMVLSLALMRHSYSLWISLDFWITPWEPGEEQPMG